MATHDYNIANQGFPAFRADLNDALAAIVSNNSNATAPATTFAHQWWMDTSANPSILKVRNADNDAWITLGTFNQSTDTFTPSGVTSDKIEEGNSKVEVVDSGTGYILFEVDGAEVARFNPDQLVTKVGSAATPAVSPTGDLNTGIFFPAADQVGIATNGVERVEFGNSETVFNDGGANVDFRVEGDTEANLLFVDASADKVGVGTNAPAVALDVVGRVRASTGILFGTDTADANALDDYEEGTFTPTIEFGFASAGQTYSSRPARYTKIGRVVTFIIYCAFSNKGTSTGNASVSGLPFTSANISDFYATPTIWNNNMTGFTGNVMAYINPNTTRINAIQYQNTGNASNITNSNFQNNSDMMFTGFYITD